MKDYYLKGEERFGPITSRLYDIAAKIRATRDIYDFATADLAKSNAKTFLDVGCGPADVPLMLSKNKSIKIYCIDPSRNMIKIAQGALGEQKNVKIALGSSRSVPFKIKFDIVYTVLSFHHWQKKAQSLKYLKRLISTGGEIRIYEYKMNRSGLLNLLGLSAHTLNMEDLMQAALDGGLKITKTVDFGRCVRVSLR